MACKEAGKREPHFEVMSGEVSVTFYADSNVSVKSDADNVSSDVVNNVVNKSANNGVSKTK